MARWDMTAYELPTPSPSYPSRHHGHRDEERQEEKVSGFKQASSGIDAHACFQSRLEARIAALHGCILHATWRVVGRRIFLVWVEDMPERQAVLVRVSEEATDLCAYLELQDADLQHLYWCLPSWANSKDACRGSPRSSCIASGTGDVSFFWDALLNAVRFKVKTNSIHLSIHLPIRCGQSLKSRLRVRNSSPISPVPHNYSRGGLLCSAAHHPSLASQRPHAVSQRCSSPERFCGAGPLPPKQFDTCDRLISRQRSSSPSRNENTSAGPCCLGNLSIGDEPFGGTLEDITRDEQGTLQSAAISLQRRSGDDYWPRSTQSHPDCSLAASVVQQSVMHNTGNSALRRNRPQRLAFRIQRGAEDDEACSCEQLFEATCPRVSQRDGGKCQSESGGYEGGQDGSGSAEACCSGRHYLGGAIAARKSAAAAAVAAAAAASLSQWSSPSSSCTPSLSLSRQSSVSRHPTNSNSPTSTPSRRLVVSAAPVASMYDAAGTRNSSDAGMCVMKAPEETIVGTAAWARCRRDSRGSHRGSTTTVDGAVAILFTELGHGGVRKLLCGGCHDCSSETASTAASSPRVSARPGIRAPVRPIGDPPAKSLRRRSMAQDAAPYCS
eukprot:TRINITY_DN32115_c0_g1_i2.p1 TRINITY_DN32115_c0_g1~~TRINITY_DN32115_c0_g1_i2.p1  ORF type:complete len:651 (-),score=61.22 TRINITY_DN32115_c0_g1_i2:268-2100(-)